MTTCVAEEAGAFFAQESVSKPASFNRQPPPGWLTNTGRLIVHRLDLQRLFVAMIRRDTQQIERRYWLRQLRTT